MPISNIDGLFAGLGIPPACPCIVIWTGTSSRCKRWHYLNLISPLLAKENEGCTPVGRTKILRTWSLILVVQRLLVEKGSNPSQQARFGVLRNKNGSLS